MKKDTHDMITRTEKKTRKMKTILSYTFSVLRTSSSQFLSQITSLQ